ncbi:EAL domain-containing protein [Azospirillum sp. B4]|uniref:sensor domain-containing protein n=1 Tax=Azospirillum sp. B4 TaxID=95605 RepID=UPI00131F14DC|nr:EAL domain-containing protein [Azospirillum sp. B4]
MAPSISMLVEALDAVSQGVLIAGADCLIQYCNAAFTAMTGHAMADVLGRGCDLICGPDTDPETLATIRDCLGRGIPFHGEVLNYTKDGRPFWNELTVTPKRDASGALSHFISVHRDVTARKAAEAALRTAAQRHRFVLDHVLAGVMVRAADTRLTYANATACRMMGLSEDAILGTYEPDPRWSFIREDGSPIPAEELPGSLALRGRMDAQNVLMGLKRGDDPVPTWLVCNAYPVLDDADRPVEAVISFTDVTDLKKVQQSLGKSEERMRLVLRGSQDAPWDWDLATNILYYSPRWWEMIGYQAGELCTDPSLWESLSHPDDRETVRATFHAALKSGQESYEVEFRLRHKDGHYVPILSRGFILRDAQGRPIRVSGTNTNLTERRQAERRIHHLAYYDALTDLPNRSLLLEHLRRAFLSGKRRRSQGALLFLGLDHFKILNDTLGHDKGDELLRQVARRLRDCVRESDMVARVGGDEFVIMLENLGATASAAALATKRVCHKVMAAFDAPFALDGDSHRTTASVGVAVFGPGSEGADCPMKQADLAMGVAKAGGRNTLRFFDAGMQLAVESRLALEKDLRDGLERGQMAMHLQPQVDQAGTVVGVEALLRWHHPERGLVSPAEFVPLAESTGLILPLGKWVLREACATLRRWADDPALSRLALSVNVSARQFHESDFDRQVLDILDASGADPRRLKLELTESLVAHDIGDVIAKMGRLKERGVSFSLDDFGTGYSSLGYLQRLPLNELKIDRMFVRDVLSNPNDANIARIILSLAHNLGLSVIAEGVETPGQHDFLQANGCRFYQGFLFGQPVPVATFEAGLMTDPT